MLGVWVRYGPEVTCMQPVSSMMVMHVCTDHHTDQDPASAGVIVSRLADRLSEFSPRALKSVVLPPVLQAARSAPSLWLHAVPLILKVFMGGTIGGVWIGL